MTTEHPTMARTGVGSAFGTFGELLQGVLPEPDGDFLVTLPITLGSTATFEPGRGDLRVRPAGKQKSATLARLILDWAGLPAGGRLTIDSELPEGKGLASSSADLVASARAISDALGIELSTARIEAFLRIIEPTDGVLYPEAVAYHHRTARLRARLGDLPPVTIMAVDEGGQVDTIAFNRLPKPFSPGDRAEYATLLDRLGTAVRNGDLRTIGLVATRSAEMNQRIRPKSTFDDMVKTCSDIGGVGIVVAHSGTMIGVMLDESEPGFCEKHGALLESAVMCGTARLRYQSRR
ncbi:kinase [Kibdelosporangium persicum]|uniref:GHMP kinase ATP-binding subunit n=1 Tax=Kibdelosporangium persicum TaxID=2698649 RepID=A0ABX2FG30_9PSEU|nr:kinase [Kibdelosporangium persicum]NRN70330.1 GHMP kinase ATP-binding subunit [Kibdelosporangium persicum]